jgi:sortase (surface protein transpeptidase)
MPPRRAGARLTRLGLAGLLVGAALLAVVVALALSGDRGAAPTGATAPPPGERAQPVHAPARRRSAQAHARRPRRAARPVRIEIPAIGVRAPVIPLGLNPDRTLEVPTDFGETGWWTGGPRPGERGPAVVAGHVDSKTGPAVFFRLGDLRSGDEIVVVRRDGSRTRFRVQRSERYPKGDFPTAKVYGSTPGPTLRLITCGGDFDRSTGHYLDNTVVYAGLSAAAG